MSVQDSDKVWKEDRMRQGVQREIKEMEVRYKTKVCRAHGRRDRIDKEINEEVAVELR